MTSIRSLNVTPRTSFGNWLCPSSRRQLFCARSSNLKTIARRGGASGSARDREGSGSQGDGEREALKTWLENRLAAVSDKSTIAEVIRYGFNHWQGLVRFLDGGRIEMDTNSVERAMRPIVLNRRNSLFAGHDQGAVNWPCIASLIETAKLQDIDPKPHLADILNKLVNGWPMAMIDELLPWAWAQHSKARLAA